MTEQLKHTPGPWIISCLSTGFVRDERNGEAVASVYPCPKENEIFDDEWSGQEEMEANLHLIAAAPDLLDALIDLHHKTVVGTDAERHQALDNAWRAVTKATGASS